MFTREVTPYLGEIVGTCINERAYMLLTAGIKLMNDKGLIDPLIAELAICNCNGFVTLPPEVRQVLGVTISGSPSLLRNEWFSYHVNGPGDAGRTPCGFTDVMGTFCTFRDPDRPVYLAARIYSAADANTKVRVYGFAANGDRIYTPGADGTNANGFLVPTLWQNGVSILAPNADAPAIVKIDQIQLDARVDYLDLLAVDPDTNAIISLVGRYRPDETAPQYQRIRVESKEVVRVKYKRRDFKITGPDDWINSDNLLALINATRAAKLMLDGELQQALTYSAIAEGLLKDENRSNKPGGIAPPQVVVDGVDGDNSNMFYGGCRYR